MKSWEKVRILGDNYYTVKMKTEGDIGFRYYLEGDIPINNMTIKNPEMSYFSFNNFPYGKPYVDPKIEIKSLFLLERLIKDYEKYYNTINEDLHFLFEKSLSKLDYLEFLEFFYEILVVNNYTLGDNLISYLKKQGSLEDFYPSERVENQSNKILFDIVNIGKEKNLKDRFVYLAKKHNECISRNKLESPYTSRSEILYIEVIAFLKIRNNKNSIFLLDYLWKSHTPDLIDRRLEFYLRKYLSDTAIKIQIQYGFQNYKLEKILSNKDPVIIENFDLLSISLLIVDFNTWKQIILSDIKKLAVLNKGVYIDNLKDLIKTSVNDLSYRTGVSEFFDYRVIVFDYREEKKISLEEVMEWLNKINQKQIESNIKRDGNLGKRKGKNNPKLKLVDRVSPFQLRSVFEHYFNQTLERKLTELDKESINKFIFETFDYSVMYNSFFDYETSITTPKIDFLNKKYKNDLRSLFMYLHNKKLIKNSSHNKIAGLLFNNFDLSKEYQFGIRGHQNYFKYFYNKDKHKFDNIKFEAIELSIVSGCLSAN